MVLCMNTGSPSRSLTRAPTTPEFNGCVQAGSFCDEDNKCCRGNLCSSNDICETVIDQRPVTKSPSLKPLEFEGLESEVFGLRNWDIWASEFIMENWEEVSKGTHGMSDDVFRVIISVLSGVIVLMWGISFFLPLLYKALLLRTGIGGVFAYLDRKVVYILEAITRMPMEKPKPKPKQKQKHQQQGRSQDDTVDAGGSPNAVHYARSQLDGHQDNNINSNNSNSNVENSQSLTAASLAAAATAVQKLNISVTIVKKQKQKLRLSQLDAARFIASVHIVVGHLDAREAGLIEPWNSHGFGFTWVPWFMMLSGFVLSLARLHSSNPNKLESWYIFTAKRVKGIYPLYLTALVTMGALVSYEQAKTLSLGTTDETIFSVLLLQSWFPWVTESVLQSHCWFLSTIVPYWAIHNYAYRKSKDMSTYALWAVVAGAWLVPWLLLNIVPAALGSDLNWFYAHDWAAWGMPVDIAVVMLKFHPFAYLHIYLAGMACAHLVTRSWNDPPLLMRWGCVLGYAGLYALFSAEPYYRYAGSKLSFRVGTLVPLHAMLLFGLAVGADPVARFLSHPYLAPLGEISYAQYVFQFIVLHLWGPNSPTGLGFWLVLAAVSFCTNKLVRDPVKLWVVPARKSYFYACCSAIIIPLVFVALLAMRIGVPKAPMYLPGYVWYSDTASDVRIELGEGEADLMPLAGTFKKGHYALINPSLVWLGDEAVGTSSPSVQNNQDTFIFTARRHHILRSSETGFYRTSLETAQAYGGLALFNETVTWYSDIVVAKVHWPLVSGEGRDAPMDVSKVWTLHVDDDGSGFDRNNCSSSASFSPINHTLSTLSRFGPEDPRIAFRGGIGGENSNFVVTFNRVPQAVEGGVCALESRMYVTNMSINLNEDNGDVDNEDEGVDIYSDPQPLDFPDSEDGMKEKNWMLITAPNGNRYFIRTLHPYSLCRWDTNTNAVREIFHYNNEVLASATIENPGLEIHGGANAVYVNFPNITGHPGPFHLSTLHTKDVDGVYMNYLVEFEATLPFRILRISRALPLLRAPVRDSSVSVPMAFASGLAVIQPEPGDPQSGSHQILISYGSSNAESRVLRLGAYDVEELFEKRVIE